jgi:Domain of unknown function (DUF222)
VFDSQATASARKHAAVAELIRRRPAAGAAVPDGPAQMRDSCEEFTGRELAAALGISAAAAGQLLGLAWFLEVNLPGTKAAFRAGTLSRDKAAWARQLRQAGLDGDLDQLRARAYLDLLLGADSRPPAHRPDGTPEPEAPAPSGPAPAPAAAGPPQPATSSTTSRTRPAAAPACATATRSAGSTTG